MSCPDNVRYLSNCIDKHVPPGAVAAGTVCIRHSRSIQELTLLMEFVAWDAVCTKGTGCGQRLLAYVDLAWCTGLLWGYGLWGLVVCVSDSFQAVGFAFCFLSNMASASLSVSSCRPLHANSISASCLVAVPSDCYPPCSGPRARATFIFDGVGVILFCALWHDLSCTSVQMPS